MGIEVLHHLLEQVEHPFGKGSLTTTGTQYGSETTGIADSAYVAIPAAATITLPEGAAIVEVEFGLTMAIKSSETTESMLWKAQGSDAGTAWEDLIGEQTKTAAAANSTYVDFSCSGRFAPTGNFLGANPFYVRMVAKSAGTAGTMSGKAKNSSYVRALYKMW